MAQDAKRSFVLYYDYRQHLALLTDEQRGKLLLALLDYGETGKKPELEGAALMAFSFISGQMDRDAEKYAAICKKRSEAGQRGGRPQKGNASGEEAKKANASRQKQTEAKKADTENDTGTGTDNDNENENENGTGIYPPSIPPRGEEETGETGEPGEPTPPQPEEDSTPYKYICNLYCAICVSYPQLVSLSANRKKAISARWKEYKCDIEKFRLLFTKAEASPFLKGKNDRNWRADFNWLMNSDNMAKVLEGKYDKSGQTPQPPQDPTPTPEPAPVLRGFRMATGNK